jgi:hypothetical protein
MSDSVLGAHSREKLRALGPAWQVREQYCRRSMQNDQIRKMAPDQSEPSRDGKREHSDLQGPRRQHL